MSNWYYVVFTQGRKPVAGTWVQATNEEEARLYAEFRLICEVPNVQYTDTMVTDRR